MIVRSLRESAHTFERHSTYNLPAMESFIKRHITEIRKAAAEIERLTAKIKYLKAEKAYWKNVCRRAVEAKSTFKAKPEPPPPPSDEYGTSIKDGWGATRRLKGTTP